MNRRVGLIVPSSNTTIETEIPEMLAGGFDKADLEKVHEILAAMARSKAESQPRSSSVSNSPPRSSPRLAALPTTAPGQ